MERGRTFYISLVCGISAFVLLLVSVNLPAQLTFETKPYARLVLLRGSLDKVTAAQLGIEQYEFDLVKNNYAEFLRRNRQEYGSESDDSDGSDSDEMHGYNGNHIRENSTDAYYMHNVSKTVTSYDEESDSSSDEDGESSDSSSGPSQQQLADAPLSQHVGLGLFHGTVCETTQELRERCHTVSTSEAIYRMNHEASFMTSDINMPMWNNLRVESIFSVLTCGIGLIFLFASLRPCCEQERLPQYLSALSFCGSGVLVFIPIVRLMLVKSDFEQNLEADFNVTTKLMTSWSMIIAGLASPLALVASFSVIATKWVKVSKKLYHKLKPRSVDVHRNGHVVEMSNLPPCNPPAYAVSDENGADQRELIVEEKN